MVIAADDVVGTDRTIGRGKIGDILPQDLDRFLLGLALLDPRGARSGEAGTQQQAVAGLEKEPDRRAVLHQEIGAHHGHVGNHRAAEHAGKLVLLQHKLILDPQILLIVQAAHGDQVLQVAAPGVQRVLKPEEVLEAAETDVEKFGGHMPGDWLDLGFAIRLAVGTRRRSGKIQRGIARGGGQRQVGGQGGIGQAQIRSCSRAVRMPSLPDRAPVPVRIADSPTLPVSPAGARGSIAGPGC